MAVKNPRGIETVQQHREVDTVNNNSVNAAWKQTHSADSDFEQRENKKLKCVDSQAKSEGSAVSHSLASCEIPDVILPWESPDCNKAQGSVDKDLLGTQNELANLIAKLQHEISTQQNHRDRQSPNTVSTNQNLSSRRSLTKDQLNEPATLHLSKHSSVRPCAVPKVKDRKSEVTLTIPAASIDYTQEVDVEMDIIGGVTFFSFHSLDALQKHLEHVSDYNGPKDRRSSIERVGKYKEPISNPDACYLLKPRRHSSLENMLDELDPLECLVNDGLIRSLESNVVCGLSLDSGEPSRLSATMLRGRNMIGEEKQPRKGKIYGRKYGRFASKASIDYHTKKRSWFSEDGSQHRKQRSKTDELHLMQVTAWQAQQAIMALQLAPSMNNSPVKCRKIECGLTCQCRPAIQESLLQVDVYDVDLAPPLPLPRKKVGVTCDKPFCRLGCVCDSIQGNGATKRRSHCGRVECMIQCGCANERSRLRSGRMALFDVTARKNDDYEINKPLDGYNAHQELSIGKTVHEQENVGKIGAGKPRKSSRVRNQPNFSSYEKMKSLIYFDPTLWLKDDAPSRRKKVSRNNTGTTNVDVHCDTKTSTEPRTFLSADTAKQVGSDLMVPVKQVDEQFKSCEFSSCARTSLYVPRLRARHQSVNKSESAIGVSMVKSGHTESLESLCDADTVKTLANAGLKACDSHNNSMGGGAFRTHSFLIQNNGKKNCKDSSSNQATEAKVFVLEVQSDCSFEPHLNSIVRFINAKRLGGNLYPPPGRYFCSGFRVDILPKSGRPVHIPNNPGYEMKVQSQYAIRIRVTPDQPVIVNDAPSTPQSTEVSLSSSVSSIFFPSPNSSTASGISAFSHLKVMKSSESSASSRNNMSNLPMHLQFGPFNEVQQSQPVLCNPVQRSQSGMSSSPRLKPSILCSSKPACAVQQPNVPLSKTSGQTAPRVFTDVKSIKKTNRTPSILSRTGSPSIMSRIGSPSLLSRSAFSSKASSLSQGFDEGVSSISSTSSPSLTSTFLSLECVDNKFVVPSNCQSASDILVAHDDSASSETVTCAGAVGNHVAALTVTSSSSIGTSDDVFHQIKSSAVLSSGTVLSTTVSSNHERQVAPNCSAKLASLPCNGPARFSEPIYGTAATLLPAVSTVPISVPVGGANPIFVPRYPAGPVLLPVSDAASVPVSGITSMLSSRSCPIPVTVPIIGATPALVTLRGVNRASVPVTGATPAVVPLRGVTHASAPVRSATSFVIHGRGPMQIIVSVGDVIPSSAPVRGATSVSGSCPTQIRLPSICATKPAVVPVSGTVPSLIPICSVTPAFISVSGAASSSIPVTGAAEAGAPVNTATSAGSQTLNAPAKQFASGFNKVCMKINNNILQGISASALSKLLLQKKNLPQGQRLTSAPESSENRKFTSTDNSTVECDSNITPTQRFSQDIASALSVDGNVNSEEQVSLSVSTANLAEPPIKPRSSRGSIETIEIDDSVADTVSASDTDVNKSESSSSLNEAQSLDKKLDTAINIQDVPAYEQAPDVAVKSKRKQLIAERVAAVEFTEELVLIPRATPADITLPDTSLESLMNIQKERNRRSELAAKMRQLCKVLITHRFISKRRDASKLAKLTILQNAVDAIDSLLQTQINLESEYATQQRVYKELNERLELLNAKRRRTTTIIDSDSDASQSCIKIRHGSVMSISDADFDPVKATVPTTVPPSDSQKEENKPNIDNVPTRRVQKTLDAGKIVVSGQLLKMLSGQRTTAAAVHRNVTNKDD